MEIRVRFDNPTCSQTIVVSYSCNEGGSGWASLNVQLAPASSFTSTGNYNNGEIQPFAHAYNLSPCQSYVMRVFFTDGSYSDINVPAGSTTYSYYHQYSMDTRQIAYACLNPDTC